MIARILALSIENERLKTLADKSQHMNAVLNNQQSELTNAGFSNQAKRIEMEKGYQTELELRQLKIDRLNEAIKELHLKHLELETNHQEIINKNSVLEFGYRK